MFENVRRTVSSQVLSPSAESWRLERHRHHVLLDLDVTFPNGPVDPARLTVERYGEDIGRLVVVAVDAVRQASLPVRMELRNATVTTPDVFGYWISDTRPQCGRNPLARGWDPWLAAVTGSA